MEFPVEFITAASEGEVDNVTSYLDPVKYAEEWDAVEQEGRKQELLLLAFIDAAEYGHLEVLKLLRPYVNDINGPGPIQRNNALHRAAAGGFPDCVDYLLQEGATVDINACNYTPLRLAAGAYCPEKPEDYTKCVRLLIEAGAKVNRRFGDGVTLCMMAALETNHSRIKLILSLTSDKDLYAKDARGEDLKSYLRQCHDKVQKQIILDYLREHPEPVSLQAGDLAPPPKTVELPEKPSSPHTEMVSEVTLITAP